MAKEASKKHIESNSLLKQQTLNPITIRKEFPTWTGPLQKQKFTALRIWYDFKQGVVNVLNNEALYKYEYAPETFGTTEKIPMVTEPKGAANYYTFTFTRKDFFNIFLGKERTPESTESLKRRIIDFEKTGVKPIAMYSADGKTLTLGIPYTLDLVFDNKIYKHEDIQTFVQNLKKSQKSEDAFWAVLFQRLTKITLSVHKNLVETGLLPEIKKAKNIAPGNFQNLPSNFYINQRIFLEEFFDDLYEGAMDVYWYEDRPMTEEEIAEWQDQVKKWYVQAKEKTIPFMQVALESIREYINLHDTRPDVNKDSITFDFEDFLANTFYQYTYMTKDANYSHRKAYEEKVLNCIELFILEELCNGVKGLRNGADCLPLEYSVTRGGNYDTIKTITFKIIRPDNQNNFVYINSNKKEHQEQITDLGLWACHARNLYFSENSFEKFCFTFNDNENEKNTNMSPKERVFSYLNKNPSATAAEIEDVLGINKKSVYRYLKEWKTQVESAGIQGELPL